MYLISLFVLFLSFAEKTYAFSTLLKCQLEYLPIEQVTVVSGPGGLRIIEKPADGDWTSRSLADKEWESKTIELRVGRGITGYLYFEGRSWNYVFKGPNNWYTSGQAHCSY